MSIILVVEDDENLRNVVKKILQRDGHAVIEADDGALVSYLLAKNDGDLLITDIVMPEQEGIQTIIKARKQCSRLPIIGMSGGGELGDMGYYLDMAKFFGAHAVLEKPFSADKLRQIVDKTLTITVYN